MKTAKLKKYHDSRGSLVENRLRKIMADSQHFFVSKSKPGMIRGNHYHKRKSEWFYVIQGTCKVVVQDIKTKRTETKVVKDTDNIIIHMTPGQAHAFQNVGDTEMILLALINEVLNHEHPDTFRYKLI